MSVSVGGGGGKVRRVLYADDPRGEDLREAQAWARNIRSRLVHLRGELEDLGRIESFLPHDRMCEKVALRRMM